jgi:hypothetical protein
MVSYQECIQCKSLQTEDPYWLGEAYGSNLSNLDTFAAQRNLTNLAASFVIARLFRLKNVLDYGGGDGLLCRLLRDYGINCFVQDKYARPVYAQGFNEPNFVHPDLLLSFEVLEHLANPRDEVQAIFDCGAKVVMVSTDRYCGQNDTWEYLAPSAGTHIFFYSASAINLIGMRYQYTPIDLGPYILFLKPELATKFKLRLIRFALEPHVLRIIRLLVLSAPARGVRADFRRIVETSD